MSGAGIVRCVGPVPSIVSFGFACNGRCQFSKSARLPGISYMSASESLAEEWITSPDAPAFDVLCARLTEGAAGLNGAGAWPADQLAACARRGVYRWFVPREHRGLGWSAADIVRGYLRLSAACLTTTFVITQLMGACRRIVHCGNAELRDALLPDLMTGRSLATLGISHLTTSGQHKRKPALIAEQDGEAFVFRGLSPWVTAAPYARYFVVGAALEDGRQLLAAVDAHLAGVRCGKVEDLVELTASHTGPVFFDKVRVPTHRVMAGPVANVMQTGVGGATGGLQTSTLALGLAHAAIEFVRKEAEGRPELQKPGDELYQEWEAAVADLLYLADARQSSTPMQPAPSTGSSNSGADCDSVEDDTKLPKRENQHASPSVGAGDLRARCNSLVLRATQSALAAAKGRGYVAGHPAGRWCQQALFFLVWSCPQPVITANLCELAGIATDA